MHTIYKTFASAHHQTEKFRKSSQIWKYQTYSRRGTGAMIWDIRGRTTLSWCALQFRRCSHEKSCPNVQTERSFEKQKGSIWLSFGHQTTVHTVLTSGMISLLTDFCLHSFVTKKKFLKSKLKKKPKHQNATTTGKSRFELLII